MSTLSSQLLPLLLLGLAVLALTQPVMAQAPDPESKAGYENNAGLGRGPDDITTEIEVIDKQKDSATSIPVIDDLLEKWYGLKGYLNDEIALQFAVAWTSLYQRVTSSPGDDQAAGGIFEVAGTWSQIGRESGNPAIIGFRLEDRHRIGTDTTPQDLGPMSGSAWPTAVGYSEFDFTLAELWWQQDLIKDRISFRIGKQLPFAIYDYFALKSPKTGFTDATFTLNPTIAFPQFGLGATISIWPTDEVYLLAGIHDADGKPESNGFDSFFNEKEYFTIGEIGWDPTFNVGKGSYHVTAWHVDERTDTGRPDGWGLTLFGEQQISGTLPFLRYGYSDGGAALLEHMVAGGVGVPNVFGEDHDVLGIGLSWGRPSAKGLDDQYASELFYRVQVLPNVAITPSVQMILNPARNPDKNAMAVFGIRGRIAL